MSGLRARDAEFSVMCARLVQAVYGDIALTDLCAKTDDELKRAGFRHRDIKDIRAAAEWAAAEDQRAQTKALADAAPELLAALQGAIGALEFSRDYHRDLGNEDQAFCQDKLDAALAAIAKATGDA